MSEINDGGPAFPEPFCVGPNDDMYQAISGMSLRDWFAGQALPAVMASIHLPHHHADTVAASAYEIADAMLAAREVKS